MTARATSLAVDPRLGGLFVERWDNGGQVIASVTGWAQDEHLQMTGSFHMGVGIGVATSTWPRPVPAPWCDSRFGPSAW